MVVWSENSKAWLLWSITALSGDGEPKPGAGRVRRVVLTPCDSLRQRTSDQAGRTGRMYLGCHDAPGNRQDFKLRRGSNSSACRPNARAVGLLHDSQYGMRPA